MGANGSKNDEFGGNPDSFFEITEKPFPMHEEDYEYDVIEEFGFGKHKKKKKKKQYLSVRTPPPRYGDYDYKGYGSGYGYGYPSYPSYPNYNVYDPSLIYNPIPLNYGNPNPFVLTEPVLGTGGLVYAANPYTGVPTWNTPTLSPLNAGLMYGLQTPPYYSGSYGGGYSDYGYSDSLCGSCCTKGKKCRNNMHKYGVRYRDCCKGLKCKTVFKSDTYGHCK